MPKSKKQRFPKVLGHPKKDWIVKMLKGPLGVRELSNRLKEMYPGEKDKWLSPGTLQKFRKEHMKVEGDALKYMKDAAREKKLEKDVKKEHTQVKNLPSYKEKVKEAVDLHLDIREQLARMSVAIESRIETLFNLAQQGEITTRQESNLQKYFKDYMDLIEKWAKYIDRVADQRIETNINVTIIEDQMALIREAVRETMMEMEAGMAMVFLEKLDNKMKDLAYKNKPMKLKDMHTDIKVLEARIEDGYGD